MKFECVEVNVRAFGRARRVACVWQECGRRESCGLSFREGAGRARIHSRMCRVEQNYGNPWPYVHIAYAERSLRKQMKYANGFSQVGWLRPETTGSIAT